MATITNKLATQVLQKAFDNSKVGEGTLKKQESPFHEMLENAKENFDFADALGIRSDQSSLGGKAQVTSAEQIPFEGGEEGFRRFETTNGEKLMNLLGDFNQQQTHMDTVINEVLYGGKKFSNQELLVIQAHVFRVAQMTEMTVKSVELAVSSFKGVMNTQIQ